MNEKDSKKKGGKRTPVEAKRGGPSRLPAGVAISGRGCLVFAIAMYTCAGKTGRVVRANGRVKHRRSVNSTQPFHQKHKYLGSTRQCSTRCGLRCRCPLKTSRLPLKSSEREEPIYAIKSNASINLKCPKERELLYFYNNMSVMIYSAVNWLESLNTP